MQDKQDLYKIRSNKEAMQYIPRPLAQKEDDVIELIEKINNDTAKNEAINWAITKKGENTCIGLIGYYRTKWEHYRSELGYILHPSYHKKGIMNEALKHTIQYGFNEMNLHSIEAIINPINIASAKLLEKNNFIKEGHFKENELYNGKFIDTIVYSLLNKN